MCCLFVFGACVYHIYAQGWIRAGPRDQSIDSRRCLALERTHGHQQAWTVKEGAEGDASAFQILLYDILEHCTTSFNLGTLHYFVPSVMCRIQFSIKLSETSMSVCACSGTQSVLRVRILGPLSAYIARFWTKPLI